MFFAHLKWRIVLALFAITSYQAGGQTVQGAFQQIKVAGPDLM
jgi:hypothetical protein